MREDLIQVLMQAIVTTAQEQQLTPAEISVAIYLAQATLAKQLASESSSHQFGVSDVFDPDYPAVLQPE